MKIKQEKNMKKKNINRREFLKMAGAAASVMTLTACNNKNNNSTLNVENTAFIPNGQMTYRSFSTLGEDKVSLLGYGCMRFPKIPNPNGKGEIIDQESVDRLVDYAIKHGVNFFDTSPVYSGGQSEVAIGKSLKRYPRSKLYLHQTIKFL